MTNGTRIANLDGTYAGRVMYTNTIGWVYAVDAEGNAFRVWPTTHRKF